MRFRPVFKRLGIVLLALGLLAGAAHLYLYYRAGYLLRTFVEELSDYRYTARTQKLRFGYFPLRIRATGIHLFPNYATGAERTYDIRADSLQLGLRGLAPLLFYNRLEINDVRIVRPFVLVDARENPVSNADNAFNIPLKEIQDGLLAGLSQFQVDRCQVIDGGFRVQRPEVSKTLAINRIDLVIDSLIAARKGMLLEGSDTLIGHLTLNLNNPDIVIPDSNYLADVDRLYINTRRNIFSIEELRFSRNKQGDAYDTIQLSSVELRGLNWQRFLQQGIIELDSVRVKNGLAQIDLSDRLLFQKKAQKSRGVEGRVEVPMILHHVVVNEVNYALRSRRKDGYFTMRLRGDSLMASNFKLLDSLRPKLSVGSLTLNVRNYIDSDDKRTYRSGFDRLLITNENLQLQNYELVPLRMDAFGDNNRLRIPVLLLQGYELSDLLRGRLVADRLLLREPRLIIDIYRRRAAQRGEGGRGFFTFLQRLRPSLDINMLDIENAQITLQPRSNVANSIEISKLSTSIIVEKLLSAGSVKELMQVSEGVATSGFEIKGPRFDFIIDDARISAKAEDLAMRRLRGTLAENLEIDLDSVTIISKADELPFPTDGLLELELLRIGKGDVMILAAAVKKLPDSLRATPPELMIDRLETGKLRLLYIDKQGAASQLQELTAQALDMHVGNTLLSWGDLILAGKNLTSGVGEHNFKVGSWYANLPGRVMLQDVELWTAPGSPRQWSLTLPQLRLSNKFTSTEWNASALADIWLSAPRFRWQMPFNIPSTGSSQAALPALLLNQITIDNPDVQGELPTGAYNRWMAIQGGRITLNQLQSRPGTQSISLASLQAQLPAPQLRIDSGWLLQPSQLMLQASGLSKAPGSPLLGTIDSLQVQGIGRLPILRGDSQHLSLQNAGIAGWALPLRKDSLFAQLTRGAAWWANGVNYRHQTRQLDMAVFNAAVKREGNRLSFDSMYLRPHLPRDAYFKSFATETDYITLRMGATELRGLHPRDEKLSALQIDHIRAAELHFLAARDKTFPDDTITYRPLLAQQLKRVPYAFALDTLQIEDGSITYQEVSDKYGLEGTLLLDKLQGHMYGLGAQKEGTDFYDSLRIDVRARFMEAAPMYLQFAQSYPDTAQGFRLGLQLGKWPLGAANKLMSPLTSIAMRRGQADSMWLQVQGNNDYAFGYSSFAYRRMRAALLRDGYRHSYFLSGPINGVANLLLRSNNNGQVRPVYVDRVQSKGMFNYWAKIISGSVQHQMAVPGKGKKARRHQKANRAALPPPPPPVPTP